MILFFADHYFPSRNWPVFFFIERKSLALEKVEESREVVVKTLKQVIELRLDFVDTFFFLEYAGILIRDVGPQKTKRLSGDGMWF